MKFLKAKDPPRAGPAVVPNAHGLVQAYNPYGDENQCHVVIEGIDHVTDFPEFVGEPQWLGLREQKETCNEAPLAHCLRCTYRSCTGKGYSPGLVESRL
jgi:hypothetical protein